MTATPPPVAPPSPHPAAPQKTSGLAVGALILGICGIVPCLGILLGGAGIVLGILALAKNAAGRGLAVGGIIAGLGGIVVGQVLMVVIALVPMLTRAKEGAKQALCGGNLNAIGKGIAMYCTENQDAYPADLEVLARQGFGPVELWQRPSAGGRRRCDYFYFPPADPADALVYMLVACDLKGNHPDGRNVLYVQGNVKWLDENDFQAELGKPVNAAFAAALKKAEGP